MSNRTDSPAFYEERIRLLQAENQRLRDALLQKLGFPDRNIVAEVRIGIHDATVLYYPLNENGKYVADDGEAATRWRKIRVST